MEATLANNSRVLVVDRGRGPYRILYVAGRPNWEYKFLNRALAEDEQIQLVGLIRIAKREPKFEFIGRPGESSNPLFRGFGNQSKDEVERYDQPVLVRLNTRDETELVGGFPKTAEELFGYHAVMVDDLSPARPQSGLASASIVWQAPAEGGIYCSTDGGESWERLTAQNPRPSETQIRQAMNGHLCRCGTYPRVMKAIQLASRVMAGETP